MKGRKRKFNKEKELEILDMYFNTPPKYGFSCLARFYKCSETTIANIYKRRLKEYQGERNGTS